MIPRQRPFVHISDLPYITLYANGSMIDAEGNVHACVIEGRLVSETPSHWLVRDTSTREWNVCKSGFTRLRNVDNQ